MKRAAIILHGSRPEAADCGAMLAKTLAKAGVEVLAPQPDAERLGGAADTATPQQLAEPFDLVFALGGDGTFLRAAEIAVQSGSPVLGVNLGRIGFLTSVERNDLDIAIDGILAGRIEINERMALEGEVSSAETSRSLWALNDVSITRAEPGRVVTLGVSIGGEPLARITADGLVVATPTGSTAYSFSSGGPIVSPKVAGLIVTPVSPHLAFARSIVASASEEIVVEVLGPAPVAVSTDGDGWVEAKPGSTVRLRASARPLRVASVAPLPFWRIVRTKFGLPKPGE